jgi:hypothetical protein
MNISATNIRFDKDSMWVALSDGRTIGVPYAWFPRLLSATKSQREKVEIGRYGLHWPDIDEDISIAGLLAGRRDQTISTGNFSIVAASPTQKEETPQSTLRNLEDGRTPMRQPGLDHRHRDQGGEIRRKNSNTLVGTLRKEYGADFAKGYRSDAQLGTVLKNEGVESLHELLKRRG